MTITITSPAASASVSGTINVTGVTTAQPVTVKVGTTTVGSEALGGQAYSASVDTTTLANGAATLSVSDGAHTATVAVTVANGSTTTLAVADAVNYMSYSHEAAPYGVPLDYSWATAPDITQVGPPSGALAATGWGTVYSVSTAEATNVACDVYIRNYRTYALTSANVLTLIQNDGVVSGAYQPPDLSSTYGAATFSTTGGVSSTSLVPSEALQFYPNDRGTLPSGTVAILTVCEAMIDAVGGDFQYMMALGADWWPSVTAGSGNVGAGDGRFVYLNTSWQTFSFTTITGTQLAALPSGVTVVV